MIKEGLTSLPACSHLTRMNDYDKCGFLHQHPRKKNQPWMVCESRPEIPIFGIIRWRQTHYPPTWPGALRRLDWLWLSSGVSSRTVLSPSSRAGHPPPPPLQLPTVVLSSLIDLGVIWFVVIDALESSKYFQNHRQKYPISLPFPVPDCLWCQSGARTYSANSGESILIRSV
jgi:hypothetical protein